ncbi:MAG: hypothetical protein Sylvanvirus5_11 [Sylvanvirus sp.]|uniref:Protein kinase domain-containing protein n=1 Tax=Sylvanvirus sp. TaxID=2487774 RepID=A0A3G5AKB3_9VIRU|nr:MAG: hypothetical protein Sylvanvirus5_11 [Sylvanvirus sp.]
MGNLISTEIKVQEKYRNAVLTTVKNDWLSLQYAHDDLRKDKGFMLDAVKLNGSSLKYAHGDLKKDKEIVLAAIEQDWLSLQYAHDDLKKDKDFILAAIKLNGFSLKYAHGDLKKDKEIVLAAVNRNGSFLQYAHDDLKQDKEIVLVAVEQNGFSLKYAHGDLKKDKEIVLAAVNRNGSSLQYAHDDLMKDKEFILAAVKLNGNFLENAYYELKQDKDIVLAAVVQNWNSLRYAHDDLMKDKKIVLAAVRQNGYFLKYAHDDLKKDKETVLAALTENRNSLEYAHDDLKKDKNFILAIVKQNGYFLKYAHGDLKKDIEIVLAAVKQDWLSLQYAHDDLMTDNEFILAVKQQTGSLLPAKCHLVDIQSQVHNRWIVPSSSIPNAFPPPITIPSHMTESKSLSSPNADMPSKKYTLLSKLGEGGGGTVYLAERSSDKFPCAIKVFNSNYDEATYQRELNALQTLKGVSPFVLQYLDTYEHKEDSRGLVTEHKESSRGLVTELCDGNLESLIQERIESKSEFTVDEIWRFFSCCVAGVYTMHINKIGHRDLKPANILLLSLSRFCKIGDMGSSKVVDTSRSNHQSSFLLTHSYASPEVLYTKKWSTKTDVWSLGVILYELIQLNTPLEELGAAWRDEEKIYDRVKGTPFADLIRGMLRSEVDARSTIYQIMVHKDVQTALFALSKEFPDVKTFLDDHSIDSIKSKGQISKTSSDFDFR